jgi:diacylglycerol kinase
MNEDFQKTVRSLRHALRGILYAFRHERNFRIESVAAVGAGVLAIILPLSSAERAAIFLVIALVFALEIINTAFERAMDIMKPGIHPYVKVVKDLAAGAVLTVSLLAVVIGAVIFIPHITELLF